MLEDFNIRNDRGEKQKEREIEDLYNDFRFFRLWIRIE